jgi:thiosulfate/3-mercaptopyruvate sulfurtransferase
VHTTLISPENLASDLASPDLRALDCRAALDDLDFGQRVYRKGHIPGALFADLATDLSAPVVPGRTGRHPLPERDDLARRFGAWGITADTQIIAYDAGSGAFAARLWWLARWLGHQRVAVLDGGLQAWIDAGGGLETGPGKPPPQTHFEAAEPLTRTVGPAAIVEDGAQLVLIDARAPARFRGEHEPIDPVAGHIPGALSMNFEDNLNESGHWLPQTDLAARFAPLRGSNVVAYCGSGVTACHNILGLVHAGFEEPALYPGSWSEWILDPTRPVA